MRILALVLITVLWGSVASSQTIGLFADSLGMDCNLQIPFPGGPVKVYAVGTLEGAAAGGVTAAAFKVHGLPAGWSAEFTPGPQVAAMIGNPFADGTALAYSTCISGHRLLVWTALITPTSLVQDVQLQVVPHVLIGDTCGELGCRPPCVHFCGCDVFAECICAEGLPAHINGAPCVVSVTQDTWGQLKLLYR